MAFRGKKIRYITFGLDPLLAGVPAPLPDFFAFSFTLSYMIENKTLLMGSTPMALKRHLLRAEAKGPSIADDPKYKAVAARLPEGPWDSRTYFDLGRTVVIGYGIAEPFLHLLRDMARDETGELVIDLARLPLEETLAELCPCRRHRRRAGPCPRTHRWPRSWPR
jgi:hypothetical protein